jgi:3-oxoacyl-[acyl-carrier-protein] synthase-3
MKNISPCTGNREVFSMAVCIRDIAYYLPDNILTNKDLAKIYNNWDAEKICSKVGILQRHVSGEEETAVDLAEKASRQLFESNPGFEGEIDFIIMCTQSPDYILPTSACLLQTRLGISSKCGALDISLGCSGFIYSLAVAKSLIQTGIARNILLITADVLTKYVSPMDKGMRTLLGDAAAVAWIGGSEGGSMIGEFVFGTNGSGADNLIIPAGGVRLRCSEETGRQKLCSNGIKRSDENIYMNGPEIFNFTIKVVPQTMVEVLEKNNLSIDDIDLFVFHQANKYILEYLGKKIAIPKEKFYINLEETGNTASASIPIALKMAEHEKLLLKGYKVMLVGFGVGLSWGAVIVEW